MEYPNDTTSDIITYETYKTCKCYIFNCFCFCNDENALLDKLKELGIDNLKLHRLSDAARNGHLNILKWFDLHWLPLQKFPSIWKQYVCGIAAQRGHLDILKWLHSQNQLEYAIWPCAHALFSGYLDILKWLLDINWPTNINRLYPMKTFEINIHCLKYLFTINKTDIIKRKINLQQIERLKILASGVI